jgi:hypothetical protein
VLVLAGLAVGAAGCGGGAGPSVANVGTTTTSPTSNSSPAASASGGGAQADTGSGAGSSTGLRMVGASGAQMRALSACMRSHGVPSFPDPNAQGSISITGIDPNSPQFQKAMGQCAKLQGIQPPSPAQQQQMRQQALAHSACMRTHGVPNYPDPQFGTGGRVTMRIGASSGIDPNSPQYQAALKACQKYLPGIAQGKGAGPVPVSVGAHA